MITRRHFCKVTLGSMAAASLSQSALSADTEQRSGGAIAGEPAAARAGQGILAAGGNAIDALVAAAFAACVASPHNCGVGGYGGHMVLAVKNKVSVIDFNTVAPAAARADMFANDPRDVQFHGWKSVGVPGTAAGLEMAVKRYGTKTLRELLAPAIRLASEGIEVGAGLAGVIRRTAAQTRKDPFLSKLLFHDGEPLKAGEKLRNPQLAALLDKFGNDNSTESLYRGDAARSVADASEKNGGLLRLSDLEKYQARLVEPLRAKFGPFEVNTAPLTAGGITVLGALRAWSVLRERRGFTNETRIHAMLETVRAVWRDRLTLLGDPEQSSVPHEHLLSDDYAQQTAKRARLAAEGGTMLPAFPQQPTQGGTIHLSCVDSQGNAGALTLTHGEAFGACVAVPSLGLILGHGMSRFESQAGHPNSPGPGKRPLHNMCPTVVLKDGRSHLAIGGAGGRRIPNGIFHTLRHVLFENKSMEESINAPRFHTEGSKAVWIEKNWPESEVAHLRKLGFEVSFGSCAMISAAGSNHDAKSARAISR